MMANLPEQSIYESGIYQIELLDPVVGGPVDFDAGEGISNWQAIQLGNRTRFLYDATRPQALLDAIKTVDGYASDLVVTDSDSVDGLHGSQFLRSDEADIAAGPITIRSTFPHIIFEETDAGVESRVVGSGGGLHLQSGTGAGNRITFAGYENTNLSSLTVRSGGADREIWHENRQGPGTGMNSDMVDGEHASELLKRDGSRGMTGALKMNRNSVDFGGGDVVSYSAGSGLQIFSGGNFSCRIGPDTFFSTSVRVNGGLEAAGEIRSTSGNIRANSGFFYQQGDRMMSQRDDYGITGCVFARNDSPNPLLYGDVISGSSLQAVAAGGNEDNGSIGVGLWMCQGYAAGSGSPDPASRCTQFTRVL